MRNSALHLLFDLMTLVLGAAAEDLLPKVAGVGVPVLLVAVLGVARRRPVWTLVAFALAAGAMEDALSSLPMMTSVSFFLAVASLARWAALPPAAAALAYPAYQLWLLLWVPYLEGNVFHRLLLSLPVGALTALVLGRALAQLERRVALDEAG